MKHPLNDEQKTALNHVAAKNGRRWKTALRTAWERNDVSLLARDEAMVSVLLQLRGSFGPSGLDSYVAPKPAAITITRALKGYQFALTFTGGSDAAEVSFHRDGELLGAGRWDGEGFETGGLYLVADSDDCQDVYDALAEAVREHPAFAAVVAVASVPASDQLGRVLNFCSRAPRTFAEVASMLLGFNADRADLDEEDAAAVAAVRAELEGHVGAGKLSSSKAPEGDARYDLFGPPRSSK